MPGVDVDIYLAFSKALIKKYGNFKLSSELHNTIIANLAEICTYIETGGGTKADDRMIGCETLDIPKSYKSTNDVWRAKLKIATENLQKIRKMGMGNSSTAFAMGCVADLALRELDKFDKGE